MHAGHHGVDAALVQLGKTDAARTQKLVAGVLGVVLVVGIIDNALEVALVVAYLEVEAIDVRCNFS